MATYNLASTNFPVPIAPGTPVLGNGTSGPFSSGMRDPTVSYRLNQYLAAIMAVFGQVGGGGYGVLTGLDLSNPSALNIVVSPGLALVDGVIELIPSGTPVGPQYVVPAPAVMGANATTYLWLTQTGGLAPATTLVPPVGARLFLGTVTTVAGVVTSIDYSGRVFVQGNRFYRITADPFAPLDTPPAGWTGVTLTAFGNFYWDGTSHKLLIDPHKQFPAPSVSKTINATYQVLATDPSVIYFTAHTGDQVVKLPNPATLPDGWSFAYYNDDLTSEGHNIVLKDYTGATTYCTIASGQAIAGQAYRHNGVLGFPGGTWTPAAPSAAAVSGAMN